MTLQVLQPYDGFRGVQILGDMWVLTQGRRSLRCLLSTHPLGWELRLSIGENLSRSQVCRLQREVFDFSEHWRSEAEGKGWTPPIAGLGSPAGARDN
jgi:hypothetical protein